MRIFFTIFLFFICGAVFASDYGVYDRHSYKLENDDNEKILFILDFSNSMSEFLDGQPKYVLMLNTVKKLIAQIPPQTAIGMRVYGHRGGFTSKDMCRASKSVASVCTYNNNTVINSLSGLHPSGMTPITYSLKQAIRYDFAGITGKKRIILLTDGGENCDESPCTFVMELIKTRRDIFIDVIAFNIEDEDDLDQLECTALVTSGKFYTADTACELAEKLAKSVGVKKEVEAKIIPHY